MKNKRIVAKIFDSFGLLFHSVDETLIEASVGLLDRGDISNLVDFAIYVNRGSLSFVDTELIFNNSYNNSNCRSVEFFLADKNAETLLCNFDVYSVSVDEDTHIVTMEIISPLSRFSNEKMTNSVYPFNEKTIEELCSSLNSVFPFDFFIEENNKNITAKIGCPYIQQDKCGSAINKVCQAGMSRVLDTPYGSCKIKSPFSQKNPIVINPSNIISIKNNGFASVESSYINVKRIEKITGEDLEGSVLEYSVDFDNEGQIINTSGLEITNTEQQSVSSGFSLWASGKVEIQTPYKIFSLLPDITVRNWISTTINLQAADNHPSTNQYSSLESSIVSSAEIVDESKIRGIFSLNLMSYYSDPEVKVVYTENVGGKIRFPITTFIDNGEYTLEYGVIEDNGTEFPTNDLIQDISYFTTDDGDSILLGRHILDEIKRRYSKGIELLEIECLFGDYYDENGNKVFDKSDLSKHIERYDIVIPYIKVKNQIVPLRKNDNGTPKKFRVIGISYYYDGLLKQRLQLHEERYDVD